MPDKLHRHFQWIGVGVYLLSLIIVSVWLRPYALKPLWMAWGIGTVCFFFLTTWFFHKQWRHDDVKKFTRKVFLTALGIRMVYVGAIIFYYYYQTGVAMEHGAADSMRYHQWAIALAKLAREGEFGIIFRWLNANTIGFSDQGYVLYLTSLYTCFDNNILGPRLLKALMSAYMCVAIYKLASRSLGEKTGRLAAVIAVFLPQFIHYTGTYLKETVENNQNQKQTLRDGIFAALALHIFYKNSDIVEFAMETQLCNLLQSLFETDGARIYKTPTYYVMKLFKEHMGQYIVPVLPDDTDKDLDAVATISEDGNKMTVSIVNRHLYEDKKCGLRFKNGLWKVEKADEVNAENVRDRNTFENPEKIKDRPFKIKDAENVVVPAHSVVRICLKKA